MPRASEQAEKTTECFHRQFRVLLVDLEIKDLDVLYNNHLRWLSLDQVLRRVWELREELVIFLEIKSI